METGINDADFDLQHIWHPFTSLGEGTKPMFIAEGKGVYLITKNGRRIIDAISSWWVNLHGHSNPVIADAIYKQANSLEHVIFAGFTHSPAISLARNLLSVLPSNQQRIFFSDNGSTAVEVGIKMALQYFYNQGQPRKKIIAFENAYHGDTFGSMSVGGRSAFTAPFNDFLFEVEFLPVPNEDNIKSILQKFIAISDSNTVAAFIYEPLIQGAAGMIMYKAAHLEILVKAALERGIICIADEVLTGFGRTAKWFASDYLNIPPDIMCVSKGITGGTLPLGVTTCSEKIVQAFQSADPMHTFFHGHSYTANPISCAAANASFQIMSEGQTWERIHQIERLHQKFRDEIESLPVVRDVRCLGTILAVEIETGKDSSYFNEMKKRIYSYFLDRNILLRPLGNIIYILPPYVITPAELNKIYGAIRDFLKELSS
jgi:adenosylmethionine---8-amino-7-oxononanoate aminotransferase